MVTEDVKARVLELWRDPSFGLTGIRRFQQKLRNQGIQLCLSDIRDIVQSDPSHELFSYNPRARVWNTIIETGVGHGMQMDLMDMSKIATRNKNFYWILCIIDVYSRYAWAFPIKRKTQQCVHDCLKAWLKTLSSPPKRLTSDAGKEFTNSNVRQLLNQYGIIPYFNQAGDKTTTGIVERFNRTLRDLMGRNFTRLKKLHWLDDLPMLVQNYNGSLHSTLGASPEDIWNGKKLPRSREIHRERFPFHDGDFVRVLLPQGMFDKRAGSQRWSTELYTVVRREGFKYVLKNIKNEVLKKKYRPSHLRVASKATMLSPPAEKPSTVSIRQQLRDAANKKRRKRILRQLGAPPPRNRRVGLRPSTRKRHLRPRHKK